MGWYAYGRQQLILSRVSRPSIDADKRGICMSTMTEIRPFRVEIPDEALTDLRNRVAATRWPDRETVTDQSQGVPLAKLQELVRYWGSDYDWRIAEATLNSLPQFKTEIDGLDIHFLHVRSSHPDAFPLITTPGSP